MKLNYKVKTVNNIHNTVGTHNSLPSKKEQSFDVMDTITY